MAGTQNLENTASAYGQQTNGEPEIQSNNPSQVEGDKPEKIPVKEDFLRYVVFQCYIFVYQYQMFL